MEIGIVGLPNVGKSTLFNALLKKQVAFAANYPFATIEPNIGVVPVPDPRLAILADVVKTEKIVPATVKFVDIAGLVKGASQGEGLGNKFLQHIREVDAILFLLRDFGDENIIRVGSVNPEEDLETLRMELELADMDAKEKINLLAKKPAIIVYNTDEDKLNGDSLRICAKLEEELASLSETEAKEYLKQLGISETGFEKVIKAAFEILGLQTFLTAGEKEVRAWTIKKGTKAPQAAGVIHTDFEKHFIKADCVDYDDFVKFGGWTKCREEGKVRTEGRDYVMAEGDVVEFKVGV
ncbi:MAG: GTP-binding protein YchF [Candidatus Amesbacteria bacterium GW2011_GWA2_42_12]|uniref:GTP-binding protein YchF n=1 Tax=Candidatus Amesbacteria bacterium GW2011_GWA2_42_12 TaxID=1618356 RepID=A0A0G0Y8M3_9BACT|nr:MAG: GTP-binding protein YchF [Candidatus Amesbacteria bacterium GW2011_GWA2_42_12]